MSLAAAEPLPIAEASRRGVSKLVADAENGHATILRRHAEPVAAVISFQELQRLQGLERDLVDLALVLARAATDTGRRTSLDEAIASMGFTRDQLASLDDPA
ncbi:type II toxin-antitoxin system Phd/YefM family antitoxin [Sporichthya polymorpha]|uniref:type II toxin-antitoxin system Phd/YefM family antitoxin n=1 Tax=Sporichthya polymorpha TaxID=35751 RepID=UPI000368E789|nr:type II toxin-antitoxin system Phd/YefM family antitoxin [Sporichthya polymorpha]